VTASTPGAAVDTGLVSGLRAVVKGEVSDSTARRAQYSTDASNYRIPPQVVVFPEDAEDLEAIAQVSRDRGVPLTMRGGGTSVAGNSIGRGIVVDASRRMNQILDIDAAAGIAIVQPGVVLTALQKALSPHGLRFGPDPSTQSRAVIGGMIGNNACGPRAVAYGRTADNVSSLEAVDGRGRRFRAEKGLEVIPGLLELVDSNLGLLRTELGRFGRQVSGYSLEHLLPENGRDLAKALVGTEGTIAVVLEASLKLVPVSPAPALVVLGYPDMATAADAVPALLAHRPLAIEGIDARLVDVLKRHSGAGAVPELPAGGGWLLVEVGGENAAEADYRARQLVTSSGTSAVRIYPAGPAATALWRIREDGAGLAGRTPAGNQAWPGWEDAAVPPERLGAYMREFEALMANYGVEGLPYGHFGDGCIHVRIDIPLEEDGTVLRSFVTESAKLVVAHGGSLSGEHGDGRARSELLGLMYTPRMIGIFGAFKHLFDPKDLLNPGIIVAPAKLDRDLRRPQALPLLSRQGFSFAHDGGDFTKAVHRCVGVGKCRAGGADSGAFMCPSFQATRDENDVTRGRARVLQEMVNGSLITQGWQSPEVHDALDLCLSCKACSRDCPVGVDMAQYKSEVLFRRFRRRIRPKSHYVLGWLPRWARLAGIAPRLVNAITQLPFVSKLLPLGGMDSRRRIPKFAEKPFLREYRKGPRLSRQGDKPPVVLWVDSFSDAFSAGIPGAAIRVLQDAGYQVIIPEKAACCGLTWISTGQLDGAKRRLESLLGVLGPFAVEGIPIVGLEPSCTAVLRSDLVDLLPDDPRAQAVKAATKTLAEILTEAVSDGWKVPDLSDVSAVVQPHCHQYSVMGFDADVALMTSAGASLTTLAGCCGLAGNFGMEKGHYETSVKVAENALLPALRAAPESTIFLADGFSCRTQADQLTGVSGVSLAELLAEKVARRLSL
jgi:FAD/FMN-containing dehydrogenase/Fe-S oxidoreductase